MHQSNLPWLIRGVCSFLILINISLLKGHSQDRDLFVSDASHVVGTYQPANVEHSTKAMVASAQKFIDSLTAEQQQTVLYEISDRERELWTNLPAREDAGGIRLGDLNQQQVECLCDLMARLLSSQGYEKICNIMLADDQLLRNGRPRRGFGTENFSAVIFGTPSETEPWAFQIDGHHVGVNLAIEKDSLTMSPSFIGTQPHRFTIGNQEYVPFQKETDLAHQLAMSLTDDQVKSAVLKPRRAEILTGPGRDGQVPQQKGVSVSTFSESQKQNLIDLISQWVLDLPEPHASKRMEQIKSELDQVTFSWNGNRQPKSDVSYTIQGPSLIIEYACQSLGNDPLDHLHSVYRDPTNEYGGQYNK
ncbi:MAG: DUF3500 domain-containing protein [Planctomycetota bacterium]